MVICYLWEESNMLRENALKTHLNGRDKLLTGSSAECDIRLNRTSR